MENIKLNMKTRYTFIKFFGNKTELAELPRFSQVQNTALSPSVILVWKDMKAKTPLPHKRNSSTIESYQMFLFSIPLESLPLRI